MLAVSLLLVTSVLSVVELAFVPYVVLLYCAREPWHVCCQCVFPREKGER